MKNILNQQDSDGAIKYLPLLRPTSFSPVIPIMKINRGQAVLHPAFNMLLKQVAARLSDIELAIACYDVSGLQSVIHHLKGLFVDMKMPAACRLAEQMEELAKEIKLQEVSDGLLGIKKIVAKVVQYNQQQYD